MERRIGPGARLLVLSALLAAAASLVAGTPPGLRVLPDSERPLDVLVLGIDADDGRYFMLPEPSACPGDDAAREELRAELFGLNLELRFGALFRRLPSRTHLYVAVPDPGRVKEATGRERDFFLRHLTAACGWSRDEARRRVHFFDVPSAVLFSQDAGEVLGYDARGRLVIATGSGDDLRYREFVAALAAEYPDRFTTYPFVERVSAEGGDEDVARLPDGSLAFVVGHNRIRRYFGAMRAAAPGEARLDEAQIEQARAAFSKSVFDLPILVLPEAALGDPPLASADVYHLDMYSCILSQGGPRVDALVPTYRHAPLDRMTGVALETSYVDRVQAQYDQVARELIAAGYPVTRLPFWDHPARTPVNVCKYFDPAAEKAVVMLPRYPNHMPSAPNAQARFNALLEEFRASFERTSPGKDSCQRQLDLVRDLRRELRSVETMPSPLFETRKRIIEELGYKVVEVPMYAGSGGSLDCMLLH